MRKELKPFYSSDNLLSNFSDFWENFFQESPVREGKFGPSRPLAEFEEKDNEYWLSFDIPGMNKEDIHLEVKNGQLSVSGERKEKHEFKGRSEKFYGRFERRLSLPQDAAPEGVEAKYSDGVLEVHIPKNKGQNSSKIAIS